MNLKQIFEEISIKSGAIEVILDRLGKAPEAQIAFSMGIETLMESIVAWHLAAKMAKWRASKGSSEGDFLNALQVLKDQRRRVDALVSVVGTTDEIAAVKQIFTAMRETSWSLAS